MQHRGMVVFMLCGLLFTGCVQTNATLLGAARPRMPVTPQEVAIYRTAAQVPGQYEEVALLHSKGASTATTEPQMFESMRQKAAEVGANGIILDAISEPSAGAKIAGAFLGYAPERQGKAIAIYIYPTGQVPTGLVTQTPHVPTATVLPVSPPSPAPAVPATLPQPTTSNVTPSADTQMRNLDREFKAGKISFEEYRKIKKILQGNE